MLPRKAGGLLNAIGLGPEEAPRAPRRSIELRLGAALVRLPLQPGPGLIRKPAFWIIRAPLRGAARVVAGNSENPSPPESFRRGGPPRKLLPLYRALERESRDKTPFVVGRCAKPQYMHLLCSNGGAPHVNCTSRVAIGERAYGCDWHNKRVGSTAEGECQSFFRLGYKAAKRKKLDARKRPSFGWAAQCSHKVYCPPRIDKKRTTDSMPL